MTKSFKVAGHVFSLTLQDGSTLRRSAELWISSDMSEGRADGGLHHIS